MCWVEAAVAVGSALFGHHKQQQAQQKQEKAQAAATQAAKATADAADQAYNKANQKAPNMQGLYEDNVNAGKAGVSGTLSTTPQGVDPKTLLLGKTTLLGG